MKEEVMKSKLWMALVVLVVMTTMMATGCAPAAEPETK
jgi:hypothetical protein